MSPAAGGLAWWRWRAWPTHGLNGAAVALGVAAVHTGVGALAGSALAGLALGGAVCTSLADAPVAPARAWRPLLAAGLASTLAAAAVALLRPWPWALGLALAVGGALAMLLMAWGARAAAVAFSPVLAMVFTLAVPAGAVSPLTLTAWHALGSVLYVGWALLSGLGLRRRWRTLAVVGALQAAAGLLQARAAVWRAVAPDPAEDRAAAAAATGWVQQEAALAEALQAARDAVFAAAGGDGHPGLGAVLLHTIDLRDVLLASRLDLDLIGRDAPARQLMQALADALDGLAGRLGAAARTLQAGRTPAAVADRSAPVLAVAWPAGDARTRLLPVLQLRLQTLVDDVRAIEAALQPGAVPQALPLTPAQLRRFVSPSGWPLSALRAQLTPDSPVLRHALRTGLAFGSAYALAQALPWAAHPHWLVLSVAVVLRGNLAQTLARRNQRVLGTLLGCALVLLLALAPAAPVQGAVFLLAVGLAHAFVVRRYWLTAAAATVMALLQAHLMHPGAGFAVGERVADTLIGALLAWLFSYVLPAWERRQLPQAVAQVQRSLAHYAGLVLAAPAADPVALRLARRLAYDALGALAAMLQRSAAEPSAVRLPAAPVAALLDHGQRLMAHLSVLRLVMARQGPELTDPAVASAVAGARAWLVAQLPPYAAVVPLPALLARLDADATAPALTLPDAAPEQDAAPWLLRRLAVLLQDGRQIGRAAAALRLA